jgi:FkbM family methyltransferase
MGLITSVDLFGLDEIIFFSLYQKSKECGLAIELGANIGLQSIVLSKLGHEVFAFELDPIHFKKVEENCKINLVENVQIIEIAISSVSGSVEFIRIMGNTTGSHFAGSRGKQPNGETNKFQLETVAISELLTMEPDTTLVKMDVEGFEAESICSLESNYFKFIDFFVEVGSKESARIIY